MAVIYNYESMKNQYPTADYVDIGTRAIACSKCGHEFENVAHEGKFADADENFMFYYGFANSHFECLLENPKRFADGRLRKSLIKKDTPLVYLFMIHELPEPICTLCPGKPKPEEKSDRINESVLLRFCIKLLDKALVITKPGANQCFYNLSHPKGGPPYTSWKNPLRVKCVYCPLHSPLGAHTDSVTPIQMEYSYFYRFTDTAITARVGITPETTFEKTDHLPEYHAPAGIPVITMLVFGDLEDRLYFCVHHAPRKALINLLDQLLHNFVVRDTRTGLYFRYKEQAAVKRKTLTSCAESPERSKIPRTPVKEATRASTRTASSSSQR